MWTLSQMYSGRGSVFPGKKIRDNLQYIYNDIVRLFKSAHTTADIHTYDAKTFKS